jgi:hypothetical protein
MGAGPSLAVARGLAPMPGSDPKQPPAERIARAMAAVDGSAWKPLLPQARVALGEVWRMMDGKPAATADTKPRQTV